MENESHQSAPVNPIAAPATYSARAPSRFLFESLLIVLSVVLGFVVTQWRDSVAEQKLAARVLANVLIEVQANLAQIDEQILQHESVVAGLSKGMANLDSAPPELVGLDFVFSQVGGNFAGKPLRQAAWDAAVSSGSLRLIDYEVAAALSEIYVGQEDMYDALMFQAGTMLFTPDTFDPARREAVVKMILSLVTELRGRETRL
jgi:hypothetical protein